MLRVRAKLKDRSNGLVGTDGRDKRGVHALAMLYVRLVSLQTQINPSLFRSACASLWQQGAHICKISASQIRKRIEIENPEIESYRDAIKRGGSRGENGAMGRKGDG